MEKLQCTKKIIKINKNRDTVEKRKLEIILKSSITNIINILKVLKYIFFFLITQIAPF